MAYTIYAQPLWRVVAEIILGVLSWAVLSATLGKKKPKLWWTANLCLLAVSVFGVLLMTILRRAPAEHKLILMPGYFLQEGKIQPEIYRALLMNVLLFVPFGLSLSAALPADWKVWRRVLTATLLGLAFSLTVEAVQYLASLGRAEADDVLANTIGTLLGALHVQIGMQTEKRIAAVKTRNVRH